MASRSESIFTLGDAKAFLQCATGGGVLNRRLGGVIEILRPHLAHRGKIVIARHRQEGIAAEHS